MVRQLSGRQGGRVGAVFGAAGRDDETHPAPSTRLRTGALRHLSKEKNC